MVSIWLIVLGIFFTVISPRLDYNNFNLKSIWFNKSDKIFSEKTKESYPIQVNYIQNFLYHDVMKRNNLLIFNRANWELIIVWSMLHQVELSKQA